MKPKTAIHRATVCCMLMFLGLPARGAAQQQAATPSETILIQALLAEIRELRLALERSTLIMPKMQLAIARVQMQQERVDRRERELQLVRDQLATEALTKDRSQATLRQYEEQARLAPDPAARKQFEEAATALRTDLDQQSVREQQMQIRQSDSMNLLKIEQAKLSELSDSLDKLDKALKP